MTSGVPQGSVHGPLLLVLFINDLSKKILNDSKLYADDKKVISIIKNLLDGTGWQIMLDNFIKIQF